MNPAPTTAVTRRFESTRSSASGRTSNSATATTMPPVNAITVASSLRRRNATTPPSVVETAVATARGTATQATVATLPSASSGLDDDDAVVVGVQHRARRERRVAERERHVRFAVADL